MEKMNPSLLSRLPVERVVARVGLISDTHMPERCAAFPTSTVDVLRGVDLLLHAGDLGELWVLDRLSAIAPGPTTMMMFRSLKGGASGMSCLPQAGRAPGSRVSSCV